MVMSEGLGLGVVVVTTVFLNEHVALKRVLTTNCSVFAGGWQSELR